MSSLIFDVKAWQTRGGGYEEGLRSPPAGYGIVRGHGGSCNGRIVDGRGLGLRGLCRVQSVPRRPNDTPAWIRPANRDRAAASDCDLRATPTPSAGGVRPASRGCLSERLYVCGGSAACLSDVSLSVLPEASPRR